MFKTPFPLVCCALAVGACSHRQPPVSPVAAATHVPYSAGATQAEMGPLHSYLDLVRSAAARDGATADEPDCLLQSVTDGERFVGEVAMGIRPLPLPSVDLDSLLVQNISVNLLTGYGRQGETPSALAFSAFSYAPPSRAAVVVILTDQGAYVRGVNAGEPLLNRVSLEEAARAANAVPDSTVFIAAEAKIPLSTLRTLMSALSSQGSSVALAVNLAPNTSLPVPAAASEALCPDGLPDTSAAQGDLPVASLTSTLSKLRERAVDCLANADARGAAGGRMTLAIRVAASGGVEGACVIKDETGDPRLRSCVVTETRKLSFAAPSPSGSVDLELPLALTTRHRPAPHALCSAADGLTR